MRVFHYPIMCITLLYENKGSLEDKKDCNDIQKIKLIKFIFIKRIFPEFPHLLLANEHFLSKFFSHINY